MTDRPPARRWQLGLILAAGSLLSMAGSIISPIRPEIISDLNIDPVLGGNLGSVHNLTIALFSAPLGIVADRVGPVRVLVPSLISFAVFGVAGAWMSDLGSLLLARGLLGVAAGGVAAGSLGAIAQMYRGEARTQAIALATATLTLSSIVYLLLGGWVGSWGWRFAFYLYSVGAPLAILLALAFQQAPIEATVTAAGVLGEKQPQLLATLRYPPIVRVLATIGAVAMALYAVTIYAPEYLQASLDLGPKLNSTILAARALGAAVISAVGAKPLARAVSRDGAIGAGFGVMCAALVSIPLVPQVLPTTVTALVWGEAVAPLPFGCTLLAALGFGAGVGLVLPNLYAALADYAPDRARTSLLAIGTGISYLGQFFSPIVLGPLLWVGELPVVFYAAAGITLLTGLTFFGVRRR